jgi:hypothetical protein
MPLTWVYYLTENKNSKLFNWVNKTIGKKPVYFNNEMKENSVVQISKYLDDIGYFNSGISTEIKNRRGISKVYYGIYPAKPYIVNVVTYKIADSTIYRYVMEIEETLPVKKGEIYNAFDLDDERGFLDLGVFAFIFLSCNLFILPLNLNRGIHNRSRKGILKEVQK